MSQQTSNHSFDELARGLASGNLSRAKALRLMGAALVGGTLTSFGFGGIAAADQGENEECKPLNKKCRKNHQCCSGKCEGGKCVVACPPGQVLCGGSCVSNSCLTNSGQVFNTSTCQCECPTDRVKMPNGTCAKPCTSGGDECGADCGGCLNVTQGTSGGTFCAAGQTEKFCSFDEPFCDTGELCSFGVCFTAC